ncbi:MAG TPA: hypothetical protein PL164_01510 [Candidatus Paceibacterota bacterium]|nr:hypothetical protein [Candidatus Paceibacterota bacterium]HOK97183.1 hypothetical protein [Candidatus Paceibacterota bacterium]HPP64626.1 hypothetical protein [Candidatus Paceibacterota bacterium]
MTKKTILLIILVLALAIGGVFLFVNYKNSNLSLGSLKLKVYPSTAQIKINEKIYSPLNGNLNIKLKPGEYLINCFLNGYLPYEQKITIQLNQETIVDDIYLLPLNWPKKLLVEKPDIVNIYFSKDNNRILYLQKIKDKNAKIIYLWEIFDRETKKTEEIFTSPVLPLEINFVSKKILTEIKSNSWQIILPLKSLLRDLNIVSQSLNTIFEQQLKEINSKLSKEIKKAAFTDNEENKIIIQTKDAIFLYDSLANTLSLIYEGESSEFINNANNLYFLDKSGLLTKINLNPPFVSTTLSLFSFETKNLEKAKIRKDIEQEHFLIITSEGKLYYLEAADSNLPVNISENAGESDFINMDIIVFQSKDKEKEWTIYNLTDKTTKLIESFIKPIQFLKENYWLIVKDDNLKVYDLENEKFISIAENVLPDTVFFDKILKRIFFVTNEGINEISY